MKRRTPTAAQLPLFAPGLDGPDDYPAPASAFAEPSAFRPPPSAFGEPPSAFRPSPFAFKGPPLQPNPASLQETITSLERLHARRTDEKRAAEPLAQARIEARLKADPHAEMSEEEWDEADFDPMTDPELTALELRAERLQTEYERIYAESLPDLTDEELEADLCRLPYGEPAELAAAQELLRRHPGHYLARRIAAEHAEANAEEEVAA